MSKVVLRTAQFTCFVTIMLALQACANDSSRQEEGVAHDLSETVAEAADYAVNVQSPPSVRASLDYSFESLDEVVDVLDIVADVSDSLGEEKIDNIVQDYGCYVLEVISRKYGGEYRMFMDRNLPVLIVGLPESEIVIFPLDQVRGIVEGDGARDFEFYVQGVIEKLESLKPGQRALLI